MFQAEEWPYDSKVRILGFEDYKARVPSGEAFVLHIEALRERPDGSRYIIPKTVQISFRFGQGDWQTVEPNSKANEEGTYRYPLGAVFRPVEITVRAGDYKSPIHRIFIARRPELPNPVLSIVPPKYTRQKNTASRRTRAAAGSVPVPVGSKVTLTGEASKDLSRVLIYRNGKSVSGVKLTGPRTFEIAMATNDPKSSGTCKVILRDTEGVTNHSAALFSLLIEPDHRPVVRAKPVGIGDRITGVARVPFEIEVRDKYGLSEVGIRYELHRRKKAGGSRPATVHGYIRLWRAAAAPGSKQFSRERRNLDLEDEFEKKRQVDTEFQRAEAGDRLRVWIEATDYGVGERLTRFPEQGFHFSIVPQTVLHKHLLDQQKRLRRQYSTLVEREKGISWGLIRQRNMTEWKITKDNQMILDKLGTEQRRILRASLRLATAIEQIREQMENNRLDRKGDMRKKLRYKVISPMKDLADNQMTPFAADLERMAQQLGQKPVKQLDEAIDEAGKIVTRMQKILLAMERSEVFDEVVTRLRSIIRLQQELRRLTAEAHRKKVEGSLPDIFGQPTKEEKERKPSKPKKNKKNK